MNNYNFNPIKDLHSTKDPDPTKSESKASHQIRGIGSSPRHQQPLRATSRIRIPVGQHPASPPPASSSPTPEEAEFEASNPIQLNQGPCGARGGRILKHLTDSNSITAPVRPYEGGHDPERLLAQVTTYHQGKG